MSAADAPARRPRGRDPIDHPAVSWLLVLLILFSVASMPMETMPGLSATARHALAVSEVVVVAVFTMEYLWRLYRAENRRAFVFGFHGIVDLLAILPFYLAFALDLRGLRMLRLVRLLKLVRFDAALGRMARAFAAAREELAISLLVLGVIVYFAAFGIFYFEHAAQPEKFTSMMDALWWAVATVTTVGYGDIYPITVGGRLFTFVVLIASLGLVAAPTGIFASALLSVRSELPEQDAAGDADAQTQQPPQSQP